MSTDALIDALARDARPVSPRIADRGLAIAAGIGAGIAIVTLLATLGSRPDLPAVASGALFWAKMAYVLGLGAAALALLRQLARPDSQRLTGAGYLGVPVLALGLVATVEIALTAAPDRAALLEGPSWTCVPPILALTMPVFAGLVVALRRMAPTRPRAAGAAAGLAAAAIAAAVYALHCSELSPLYVLTRYSAALALAALAGAVLGPRLLRW